MTTDQHGAQSAPDHKDMVVVDDIAKHLYVRPATEQQDHSYDRAAIAATMAAVLTRHLEPDLRVEADGTVLCRADALAEQGFAPEQNSGLVLRRSATRWEEIIVAHVDLDYVERAGRRAQAQASA